MFFWHSEDVVKHDYVFGVAGVVGIEPTQDGGSKPPALPLSYTPIVATPAGFEPTFSESESGVLGQLDDGAIGDRGEFRNLDIRLVRAALCL